MNEGYSFVLTRCMLFSFAGLATALLGILPPVLPFFLAMVPLVWYHLYFLRKFAGEGISQPAVDSVYYYGFLITIGALGVSALELARKGVDGNLTQVAFQFGLGLLATGYAVWARIQLTATSSLLDEANLEEAMNRYVERSRELVSAVELATASFNNYASTVIDKTEQFALLVEAKTQTNIDAAAAQLRDAVVKMAEESTLALADLRGIINDTTFGAEREALRVTVTSMVDTVGELSATLADLKTNSAASVQAVGSLAGGLVEITTQSAAAASVLEDLGRNDGVLQNFRQAVALGEERIGELSLSAGVAAVSTTSLSDKLSASVEDVASFAAAAKQGATAFEKLDAINSALASFTDELGSTSASFDAATKSATSSQGAFESIGSRLSDLHATLKHLNEAIIDATGGLKDAMISTSDALDQNFNLAMQRTEALAASLQADRLSKPALSDGAVNGAS